MITEDKFTDKQWELYELMSDISEDCYCAGWMIGNEYTIWRALQTGEMSYGMGDIDAEQLARCRELATELDGWIVWVKNDGPHFVPMAQWLEMVTANV